MTTRNIQALEHKGVIYLRLDDLEAYLRSCVDQTASPVAKNVLYGILHKLREVQGGRPVEARV